MLKIIPLSFFCLVFSIYAQAQQSSPSIINYELKKFGSVKAAQLFYRQLDSAEQHILCNINRQNAQRLLSKSSFWIPNSLDGDLLKFAPFPDFFQEISDVKKLMIISIRLQAFGLYEYGHLQYWGAVSTGKKSTPTPTGLHYMTFRKKVKVSTINDSWIMPWYFNIDVNRGIALHEYDLPGYPASHGCIRMQMEDARYVYGWGEQWRYNGENQLTQKGTPVILFGRYDYDKPISQIFETYKLSEAEMNELSSFFLQL